jgi:hypothetical protein
MGAGESTFVSAEITSECIDQDQIQLSDGEFTWIIDRSDYQLAESWNACRGRPVLIEYIGSLQWKVVSVRPSPPAHARVEVLCITNNPTVQVAKLSRDLENGPYSSGRLCLEPGRLDSPGVYDLRYRMIGRTIHTRACVKVDTIL